MSKKDTLVDQLFILIGLFVLASCSSKAETIHTDDKTLLSASSELSFPFAWKNGFTRDFYSDKNWYHDGSGLSETDKIDLGGGYSYHHIKTMNNAEDYWYIQSKADLLVYKGGFFETFERFVFGDIVIREQSGGSGPLNEISVYNVRNREFILKSGTEETSFVIEKTIPIKANGNTLQIYKLIPSNEKIFLQEYELNLESNLLSKKIGQKELVAHE